MSNETTLHLFCGKMAAGKSTLARKISDDLGAILLVEDQWLESLYPGEITNIPEYLKYSARLKSAIFEHVYSLLKNGTSVVLDFPGNTPDQRKTLLSIAQNAGVTHTLHYVDVSDEVCKRQLQTRNNSHGGDSKMGSEEVFDLITEYFQPPTENEGLEIVKYER